MSRDYKKPDRSSSRKEGSPLFAGVLIGLVVGLAVAIGVALYINFSPKPFVSRDKLPEESAKAATNEGTTISQKSLPAQVSGIDNKSSDKPRFDFYTILPGSEQPVSEQDIKQAAKQNGVAKDSYFLQVGSFQAAAEADNMKARLAFLGLEATIQTADITDKGIWHRVRIGPFADIEEMKRSRTLLAQNNIPASLVKIKEP